MAGKSYVVNQQKRRVHHGGTVPSREKGNGGEETEVTGKKRSLIR